MDTIIPFEWQRMLIGDEPPLFLLEIVFRIAIIWPWTMLLLRWVGGRSLSQLSLVEFLLVIALGSAVGDSMLAPDVPLLPAMLVILTVIVLDKVVNLAIRRFDTAKKVIDGRPTEVLRNGVILSAGLQSRQLGNLELMELLRLKGVENLGSIARAYLEPSGQLSVFPLDTPGLGLAIVPPVECADNAVTGTSNLCCSSCGTMSKEERACTECGSETRLNAVLAPAWR
ncbi:DUF421 domain-containing protein [Cypionkella sp.]|uniref:DUF421 domain-containing protein n=1 Tax=Cypionkella sp. TaxID=2811411 RepID=UPI002ABCBC9F|nr:YetF domain-containing protein [Cypionkella sp.]MDZ4394071.1 DUF421 domain-containing protein [Cypionkella sp.]